ncbi:MAG TPA: hypothetical protein VFE31_02015 [Opitutaceae bacterium]|jgi:hypothetical protein|nr:hypothetical protein [Opitutaceae bacterium]
MAVGFCTLTLAVATAAGALAPAERFPQAEAVLSGWIANQGASPEAAAAIEAHAWALWRRVTAESSRAVDGQQLREFESWPSADELAGAANWGRLRRFRLLAADPLGFVKFNPTAADHVRTQRLMRAAALDALLAGGSSQVTPFPPDALVVKAVYRLVSAGTTVYGHYYMLPVWDGPPASPQAFGPDAWPRAVAVDMRSRDAAQPGVYSVSDFLSFHLSAADAVRVNAEQPGTNAAAGDVALLVGLHLASRETARWTWQTFWWTPDPDAPPAPSSGQAAALRPPDLLGPARHYAMAAAYAMATPNPPVLGGSNAGRALYAYNPYIEAALGPADMPDSIPGSGPDGSPQPNNCGVESNCMSCHIRASYNPGNLETAPRLAGARYTDLADPAFVGTLQTDFLWSLAAETSSSP